MIRASERSGQGLSAEQGGRALQFTSLWRHAPWTSVRGLVACGFGFLVLVLALVTAGAAWQVDRHQSDLQDLEFHSTRAALIQDVETQASIAGLLLQRYVDSGGETYPEEINAHAVAAQTSLEQVLNMGGAPAGFEEVTSVGLTLMQDASRAAELRRIGNVEAARQVLEDVVPVFREYRLTLERIAAEERATVTTLRGEADETGRIAFWLIVLSGSLGVVFGLAVSAFIARSIARPLRSLESTALAVSDGDFEARAPVTGPRELAHLGQTINTMMTTIQERTVQLEQRNSELLDARALASTDGLTGALNHRAFQEGIRALVASASNGTSISLLMLDLDGFKEINDRLGHQKGDEILRQCTEQCVKVAGRDFVYRYGGDELAVVLPRTGLAEAGTVAELLRSTLANVLVGGVKITVSIGVASYPDMAESAEQLIYQADSSMYGAKYSGKNAVRRWDELTGGGARPHTGSVRPASGSVDSLIAALANELGVGGDEAMRRLDPQNADHADAAARLAKLISAKKTSGA